MRNPVYAGYSTYRKAKRKEAADKYHRAQDIARDPTTGEPVRGQWEPIVPADLWWRAQEILDSPDRLTNAEKRVCRKHLGSGLYVCDDCGSPVRAHSDRYRCPRCGLVRSRNRIDGYVTAVIRARLPRTDLVDLLPQGNADTSAVDAELAELKAKLARVQADYDSELIEARDLKRARDRYNPRISELEAERALATASSALLDTTGYDSPVAAFDASELAVQRRVLDLLCTVRLKRGTRGTRVFDPDTVVFEWRS